MELLLDGFELLKAESGKRLEEPQQLFLPGELHELQHHAQPGVGLLGRRIETRQIQQRVVELWQEGVVTKERRNPSAVSMR